MSVDDWIEETVSGAKEYDKRLLGKLLDKLKEGDILICAELSRLGRSLMMIMEILNICLKRNVQVWTMKENYRLGDDITCKVMAFAFGIAAELERKLISQRTKEALKRIKAEGKILGRPMGVKNKELLMDNNIKRFEELLNNGYSQEAIAKILNVSRCTVHRFIKRKYVIRNNKFEVMIDKTKTINNIIDFQAHVKSMVEEGIPLVSIARALGIQKKTVDFLNEHEPDYLNNLIEELKKHVEMKIPVAVIAKFLDIPLSPVLINIIKRLQIEIPYYNWRCTEDWSKKEHKREKERDFEKLQKVNEQIADLEKQIENLKT
jgi:DNA invertase Pin-like site-specific DNA recombinase